MLTLFLTLTLIKCRYITSTTDVLTYYAVSHWGPLNFTLARNGVIYESCTVTVYCCIHSTAV